MLSILRINVLKLGTATAAVIGVGLFLVLATGMAGANGGNAHGSKHGHPFHGHGPQHGPPPFHGHGPKPKTLVVDGGTVIWNVTVVSTVDGSLDPNSIVVVKEGKVGTITSVKWTHLVLQNGAKFVDASGKYLVPGYNNMHVHELLHAAEEPKQGVLRLAGGETGVMDMGSLPGTEPQYQAQGEKMNEEIAAGLVDGPEFLYRLGKPNIEHHLQFISATADAREAVLKYGWEDIDHLGATWGYLPDCTSEEPSIRQEIASIIPSPPPIPAFYNTLGPAYRVPLERIVAKYDPVKCEELAEFFVEHETWQRETIVRNKTATYADSPVFSKQPDLKYMNPAQVGLWNTLAAQFTANVSPATREALDKFYALEIKVMGMMERKGVKFLASTDDGGIWLIPGDSLHQEFHELSTAGFTPLQVLQSTTLNVAEYLQTMPTMGTVDEGKDADLVLLDGDPTKSVYNLDRIAAVVNGGRYYSSARLAQMKEEVAASYAP